MTGHRSPWLAGMSSFLLPGAGQYYNGEVPKGAALLCMTAGIWGWIGVSLAGPPALRSKITAVLLAVLYLAVWIPATVDAVQVASGAPSSMLADGRRGYVIVMLLTVGPMALPLLWQSGRFSRSAKWIWTVAVVLICLLSIALVAAVGYLMERLAGVVGLPP